MAAGIPCVTTLTEVVQLPPPHMDAAQQIGPHGVEQIKRLIEKMGNVQKVNQLVILGLDHLPLHAQSAGMQQPQSLIQPLHFDFTQSSVQQAVLQQAGDKEDHEGTSSGTEQDKLLESLEVEVAVEQKKTVVQGERTISAECPEKQVTVVESDATEAQIIEVQCELLPELPEKDILAPRLEASHQLILTTEEQLIQDVIDVKTPDTENVSSLITDFESRITSEQIVIKSTDIPVSAMTNTNTEPSQKDSEAADSLIEPESQSVLGNVTNTDMTKTSVEPLSHEGFEAIGSLVEPEAQTGQGDLDELDKSNTNPESHCQTAVEATDSLEEPQSKNEKKNTNLDNSQEMEAHLEQQHLKEILSSEDQILRMNKPSLGNVPHDQERSPLEQAPVSESSVQRSTVETESLVEDSPYIKKALPAKKKGSKKQVIPKSQYLETQDEVAKSTLPITLNQKIVTVSKTPKKQQEKTKKRFGSKQNKKKYSKPKLLNLSKNSLHKDQHDSDPRNVPVLSHSEKLKQKHKKGRKSEKSSGLTQALNLPCEKVKKVSEQVHRGKPHKRKFENQRDLVKKGKSTQGAQQDETPVPKKKKTGKISEATQKRAKSKVTVNKENKKSHKLAKQREKDQKVSETPIIDQVKEQALLLLKGHKQPQLKVHKLDAKATGLDPQLIHKCQTKEIYGHETIVEPAKEGIQNGSLQAPGPKKKKGKAIGKKSKVDSKQSFHLPTSINSDVPSGAKQKVLRKRKAPAKIDQEIALSPPYSRLIIGCHDCGKSFSEVSALQEHMASMHSENGALQSVVPCDVSERPTVGLRPNEIMLTNAVHSSSFEIHVPADWDVESELREIGLGDEQRNEHRLSFPALSPSPSFPMTATFVEVVDKQDDTPNREPSLGHKKAIGKNSACHAETIESKVGEQESMDIHSLPPLSLSEPQENMNVREALPSCVNLVMVENQNEGDSHISTKLYNLSQNNFHKVSDPEEGSIQGPSSIQDQLPTKTVNPPSTYNAGSHLTERSDVKQEADETSVQTVASQTNTSMTRGKRGRGNKGRGKRQLGKRRSAENKHAGQIVANEEDCQVVFELYSLTGNREESNGEILRNQKAINATTASIHSAVKESPEVQEVCVLPQPVTANALEVMNSVSGSVTQKSGEHDKNRRFPSRAKGRTSVHCLSGIGGQGQVGF